MVGGGATSSQLVSPAPAPATSPEEDEILKRNTDCVYFLASPLTCKKGSECEYRHSDVARVNPRDCYYWLNGNCLNPKCAFRHPPLDGLLGSDVSTPMGPPVPAPAPHHAPYVTPKQGVACIFFQKGFCLKGHLCPFLHGPPNSVNNKPTQSPANPVPNASKMVLSNPEKPIQEQKFAQQATIQNVASLSARNGVNGAVDKKVSPPSNFREPPRYKPANVVPTPVMIEPPSSKPNRSSHHGYHVSENDTIRRKDADEYSREPSPGFDVLVDNELEESEYYHEKDGLRRSRGQDYDVDRDMYREHRDYDHYNERDGHFEADHVENLDRRPFPRSDRENGSDLRHRISKQRRGNDNGVRSLVNRDYDRESQNHVDRISRRETHHHRPDQHPDQGTLSSRLRGRIKIPGSNENNRRVERDIDIERKHLSRYSPGRPMSINQSRLRDRIKGPRDMVSDNDAKFAGPKRLSELKSVKTEHQPNNEQSLGKRKYPKTEDDTSFEGPKPLSEILKRKRGISINNNDDHISSVNTQDNTPKESDIVSSNREEHNSVSVDLVAEIGNNKPVDDKSVNNGPNEVENEDGLIDEDALLDEELEAYDDQRDGEYDYDQLDGEEDYNLDEGEYIDEEEVEEYEKKENVVYS